MNYLFIDIECANCLHGEGKICSFGYVKTDDKFNVIKKKDILIDPDAPFLLGNAKKGCGIALAYPLFRFKWAHTFPFYYEEIKNLLIDKDTIVFGFAINQDINYLYYSCKRYRLKFENFKVIDIQLLDKIIHKLSNLRGLDKLIELYNLPSFTYHRSDDDAYMSMEILSTLLKENNILVEDIINRFLCYKPTEEYIEIYNKNKALRIQKEKMHKAVEDFYKNDSSIHPVIETYDKDVWGKHFFINYRIVSENITYFNKHKKEFIRKNIIFVRNIKDADYVISSIKNVRDKKSLTLEEFNKLVFKN